MLTGFKYAVRTMTKHPDPQLNSREITAVNDNSGIRISDRRPFQSGPFLYQFPAHPGLRATCDED